MYHGVCFIGGHYYIWCSIRLFTSVAGYRSTSLVDYYCRSPLTFGWVISNDIVGNFITGWVIRIQKLIFLISSGYSYMFIFYIRLTHFIPTKCLYFNNRYSISLGTQIALQFHHFHRHTQKNYAWFWSIACATGNMGLLQVILKCLQVIYIALKIVISINKFILFFHHFVQQH